MVKIFLTVWLLAAVTMLGFVVLKFRPRRRRRSTDKQAPDGSGVLGPDIGDRMTHSLSLPWQTMRPHLQLNEYLQLEGQTVAGERYRVILEIEPNRTIQVLSVRVGKASIDAHAGQKGCLSVPSNQALTICLTDSNQLVAPELENASEDPGEYLRDEPFCLVLSNFNSLKTGAAIHVAAKSSSLESRFIKSWEMPVMSAEEALVAQISFKADVAHLAERIKDVRKAAAVELAGGQTSPLKHGVCYVLGQWGGYSLSFAHGSDVALLVVESFDPEIALADFLERLSLEPLMHARLVCREVESGRVEPMLVYPDIETGSHKVLKLERANAMLTMRGRKGEPREVLRVTNTRPIGEHMEPIFKLTFLPNGEFQNVLAWCLPPKNQIENEDPQARMETFKA
jgi:hypothetical protein